MKNNETTKRPYTKSETIGYKSKTIGYKIEDTQSTANSDTIGTENSETQSTENSDTIGTENKGFFTVKTADAWLEEAKNRPTPKMLFSEFWFEGELCILFADTNLGKSILAVQLANSIAQGVPIGNFVLGTEKQKVLYFDFELSDKQFQIRYSEKCENTYIFGDNFWRIEINSDGFAPNGVSEEDYLHDSLEQCIVETSAKVILIDNLTYLKNDNERAKDASQLMKQIKALKKKYNLSILVVAHTPKRDATKPITKNDLSGSKMLINFCDSCFAIGESSTDSGIRYLKQIKQRNTELIFGTDNVAICQIDKPANFLGFSFLGCGREQDHLKVQTEKEREGISDTVINLKKQGKSFRDIGTELNISHQTAKRIFDKFVEKDINEN